MACRSLFLAGDLKAMVSASKLFGRWRFDRRVLFVMIAGWIG